MAKAKATETPVEEIVEVTEEALAPALPEDAMPVEPEPQPETWEDDIPVNIPSVGLAAEMIDEKKYLKGSVNTEEFKVLCDEPTTIKRKFYDAVKPLVK